MHGADVIEDVLRRGYKHLVQLEALREPGWGKAGLDVLVIDGGDSGNAMDIESGWLASLENPPRRNSTECLSVYSRTEVSIGDSSLITRWFAPPPLEYIAVSQWPCSQYILGDPMDQPQTIRMKLLMRAIL
ncbi:hypothetical protein K439DRAFT_1639781, partial [Ramaria rubella]